MNRLVISKCRFMSVILFLLYNALFCLGDMGVFPLWKSLVLIANVIVLVYLEYKISHCIFSPLIMWFAFWLLPLVIAKLSVNYDVIWSTKWSSELLRLIICNNVVFYFSFIFIYKDKQSKGSDILQVINFKYNISLLYKFTIIIGIAMFGFFCLNVVVCGYIPQASGNVNMLRTRFVTTRIYSFVNILRVFFILAPLIIDVVSTKRRRWILLLLAVNYLCLFLTGWRSYVFNAMILYFSAYFFVRGDLTFSKIRKILIPVAIVSIFAIGYIAVTRRGVAVSLKSLYPETIYTIYSYIAPNFINLQDAIESLSPINSFLYTTEAIWSLFTDSSALGLKSLEFHIGYFNVSTYLLQPFADFGTFGTIVWTFIISCLSACFMNRYCLKANMTSCAMLPIIDYIIFYFHNGFVLRSSSLAVWLIIFMLCLRASRKNVDGLRYR